ncbi:E3 ubiquitin-protein ligase RNF34 [Pectinophora gossypiella]|nr:E3 ubiquitin-protein ligase RNF34 [Pectinophora gossypiella]
MIAVGGGCKMPCESCGVQFSVFRRKRACSECERLYCAACLRRGGGMCAPCRALSTRPLARQAITHLKARDLQCFLQRQNVSTRGCVEKDELVSLCVSHVNSAAYRRRGARGAGAGGAFTSLKGFTSNINELLNSAFDLRPAAQPQPPPPPPPRGGSCFNTAHAHAPAPPPQPPRRERFTINPGGEPELVVPVPGAGAAAGEGGLVSRSASAGSARVDSADCFEVEDLDDAGWEFVKRPADPLPGDSEVLMTENSASPGQSRASSPPSTGGPRPPPAGPGAEAEGGTPRRAASELELHRSESAHTPDSSSLQDEPLMDDPECSAGPEPVSLSLVSREAELEALSVKQLKELLARNRVEYRGCLERADLLERARTLYRDHHKYKDDVDSLPLEECCKICMAARLECVLLECGHIAACTQCARQLAECPICRRYVVRAVRFFRS